VSRASHVAIHDRRAQGNILTACFSTTYSGRGVSTVCLKRNKPLTGQNQTVVMLWTCRPSTEVPCLYLGHDPTYPDNSSVFASKYRGSWVLRSGYSGFLSYPCLTFTRHPSIDNRWCQTLTAPLNKSKQVERVFVQSVAIFSLLQPCSLVL
jgi:hypothetical protein